MKAHDTCVGLPKADDYFLKIMSFVTFRDIWNENVTCYLRTDSRCQFSNNMSHPRALSWADNDLLTRCHERFFSNFVTFRSATVGRTHRESRSAVAA